MSFTLTPEETRNRKNFSHPIPKAFNHILNSSAGPRLQMQYNDANNRCIGESMVLKPENNNLHGMSFVSRCSQSDQRLRIPPNATSILIFGQQGLFASQDDLTGAYRKDWSDPEPTQGIEISGPYYFSNRPYRFVLAQFDLQTGQRNNPNYVKDIIRSIDFSNNYFSRLNTIEAINIVK